MSGRFRGLSQFLDEGARFSPAHVGIRAAKIGRDGIRISDGRHARRCESALEASFIHDDPDNFRLHRACGKAGKKSFHHVFAISHLLYVRGRNKADCVNMLEARGSEFQEIIDFHFSGNDFRQSLPGIPWAFDNFYGIRQRRSFEVESSQLNIKFAILRS